MQPEFLGRHSVDFQDLVARQDPRLGRWGVLHWRDHRDHPVSYPDLHAESVEAAARVVLHVLEVVRVHELTVRIERREHPSHRGVDEVVIADLVTVDVILSDQLDRFGKSRDLRVTRVIGRNRRGWFRIGGNDRPDAGAEKDPDGHKPRKRGRQRTLHKYHVWT